MKPRVFVLVFVAALAVLGTIAAACNDNDGTPDQTTPAPDVTPVESDGVTDEVTPAAGGATPASGEDLDRALRAEAAALCPEESLEFCAEAYIIFATGTKEAALCITLDGKWFFEAPQGSVGDDCYSQADATIVAIVGGAEENP